MLLLAQMTLLFMRLRMVLSPLLVCPFNLLLANTDTIGKANRIIQLLLLRFPFFLSVLIV